MADERCPKCGAVMQQDVSRTGDLGLIFIKHQAGGLKCVIRQRDALRRELATIREKARVWCGSWKALTGPLDIAHLMREARDLLREIAGGEP